MKIACISDTHGVTLPDIPDGVDVVLHAGDIGPDRKPLQWFLGPFKSWLQGLDKRGIKFFGTWGNHDFIGREQDFSKILPGNTSILVDEAVILTDGEGKDVRVWFSPWSPTFGTWAWMQPEKTLESIYFDMEDVDIIVSHSPPKDYGDCIGGENVGSPALLDMFYRNTAKYLVCGHIHEARGLYDLGGDKIVINCSLVDETYDPHSEPLHIIEV